MIASGTGQSGTYPSSAVKSPDGREHSPSTSLQRMLPSGVCSRAEPHMCGSILQLQAQLRDPNGTSSCRGAPSLAPPQAPRPPMSPGTHALRPPSRRRGRQWRSLVDPAPAAAPPVHATQVAAEDSLRRRLRGLVSAVAAATRHRPQLRALTEGSWSKLICGASFEDVVDARNLALVYTLAGGDCIDCAADPAVVAAVTDGISAALEVAAAAAATAHLRRPWVMISINDDEDPHFRKAAFDPACCPPECPRPCQAVCPADAIVFTTGPPPTWRASEGAEPPAGAADSGRRALAAPPPGQPGGEPLPPLDGGVIRERCYGCGRCLPTCPYDLISAEMYVRRREAVAEILASGAVDAIEIHTGPGHLAAFAELWRSLGPALEPLRLVAVSIPDLGEGMIPAMSAMAAAMRPMPGGHLLWQLDGRPMSGDIGAGATRAAVRLAERVAADGTRPPGFLQLAGGTNAHTVPHLWRAGLLRSVSSQADAGTASPVAGVAYGGYARKIVGPTLKKMEGKGSLLAGFEAQGPHGNHSSSSSSSSSKLEHNPALLIEAVVAAMELLGPLKGFSVPKS